MIPVIPNLEYEAPGKVVSDMAILFINQCIALRASVASGQPEHDEQSWIEIDQFDRDLVLETGVGTEHRELWQDKRIRPIADRLIPVSAVQTIWGRTNSPM
jgi:hypothetical protein